MARVIAVLTGVIALALRLPYLTDLPGWDGDEGYTLEIAWNLAHGEARMFALDYRFVAHPPLFFAMVAPALLVFGRDIIVVRAIAAVCHGVTVGAVGYGLARAGMHRAAVIGGITLATVGFAVTYGRMAYTYALLGTITILCLNATLAWQRTGGTRGAKWMLGIAALGPLAELSGLALPLFVAIEMWRHSRTHRSMRAGASLLLALLPFALVTGTTIARDPAGTLADWHHVGTRLGFGEIESVVPGLADRSNAERPLPDPPDGPLRGAVASDQTMPPPDTSGWAANGLALASNRAVLTGAIVLTNVGAIFRADWWFPLAIVGLFATASRAGRATVLIAVALTALPAFAVRPVDIYFRTAIPLLGFAGWGLGVLLDRALALAFEFVGTVPGRGPLIARLGGVLLSVLFLLPFGIEMGRTILGIAHRQPLRSATVFGALPIERWLLRDHADARNVATWVNARTQPTDIVIASPAMTALITARVTDILQATAGSVPDASVAFYPARMPPNRWRFDPTPASARFVIIDPWVEAWSDADTAVRRVFAPLQQRSIVYQQGKYRVVLGGASVRGN